MPDWAASVMIAAPVCVEPVNEIFRISGWRTIAAPVVWP